MITRVSISLKSLFLLMRIFLLMTFLFLSGLSAAQKMEKNNINALSSQKALNIVAPRHVAIRFNQMFKHQDVTQFKRFENLDRGRNFIELILLVKAFKLGGFKQPINVIEGNDYQGNIKALEQGEFFVASETYWLSDIKQIEDQLLITIPVIESGQYEAGIYALASNKGMMDITNPSQLKEKIAGSCKYWAPDWQLLKSMQINRVEHFEHWNEIVNALFEKKVDFTLAQFRNVPDLAYIHDGIKLTPIPNIKVRFKDSRHFAFISNHPNADTLYWALQNGLRKLKIDGVLELALTESGFINAQTRDWQVINSLH